MLSGGVRLTLLVAAPMLAALVVHELRHRGRAAVAVTIAAIAACTALGISVAGAVAAGGSLEQTFGTVTPGVDLTVRADAASIGVVLVAAAASLLLLATLRADHERLAGLLLCVAGAAAVAVGGNVVLIGGGVEVIAIGALIVGGRRGPGFRTTVLLVTSIGAAGLGLIAAAAQLVAANGSSDLVAIPPGAVGGAVAVPWALAGAILVICPVATFGAPRGLPPWAAVAAAPAGYLVLLRLQQTAGGQIPGNAAVMLGLLGVLVAVAGACTALRARAVAEAGGAVLRVLTGLLLTLCAGSLASGGVMLAGIFLSVEVGLLAATAWRRDAGPWAAATVALLAFPGGAAAAVALVSLGSVVGRGPGGYPQLLVLVAAMSAAAVGVGRLLTRPLAGPRAVSPATLVAVAVGIVGGLVPGFALRVVAAPFAGGALGIDVDAAALQHAGADWAGGYITTSLLLVLGSAASARLLASGELSAAAVVEERPAAPTRRLPVVRARRAIRRSVSPLRRGAHAIDEWLEVQPGLPLVAVVALVGLLVIH